MFKLFTPIILIAISVGGFLMVVNPMYKELGELKAKATAYDQALTNSKALENERDKLTKKYNAISTDNLDKLSKLLPDNVDNIRLILEIEKVAAPYGMILKDVKYDSTKPTADKNGAVQGGDLSKTSNKDYGSWDLEFTTEGSYNNFLNFVRDLENNLRIVDIYTIQFTSDTALGTNKPPLAETYKYAFRIKTYWMKN